MLFSFGVSAVVGQWIHLGWPQQLSWPLPPPLPVSAPSRDNKKGPVAAPEPALCGRTELDSIGAGPLQHGRMVKCSRK